MISRLDFDPVLDPDFLLRLRISFQSRRRSTSEYLNWIFGFWFDFDSDLDFRFRFVFRFSFDLDFDTDPDPDFYREIDSSWVLIFRCSSRSKFSF